MLSSGYVKILILYFSAYKVDGVFNFSSDSGPEDGSETSISPLQLIQAYAKSNYTNSNSTTSKNASELLEKWMTKNDPLTKQSDESIAVGDLSKPLDQSQPIRTLDVKKSHSDQNHSTDQSNGKNFTEYESENGHAGHVTNGNDSNGDAKILDKPLILTKNELDFNETIAKHDFNRSETVFRTNKAYNLLDRPLKMVDYAQNLTLSQEHIDFEANNTTSNDTMHIKILSNPMNFPKNSQKWVVSTQIPTDLGQNSSSFSNFNTTGLTKERYKLENSTNTNESCLESLKKRDSKNADPKDCLIVKDRPVNMPRLAQENGVMTQTTTLTRKGLKLNHILSSRSTNSLQEDLKFNKTCLDELENKAENPTRAYNRTKIDLSKCLVVSEDRKEGSKIDRKIWERIILRSSEHSVTRTTPFMGDNSTSGQERVPKAKNIAVKPLNMDKKLIKPKNDNKNDISTLEDDLKNLEIDDNSTEIFSGDARQSVPKLEDFFDTPIYDENMEEDSNSTNSKPYVMGDKPFMMPKNDIPESRNIIKNDKSPINPQKDGRMYKNLLVQPPILEEVEENNATEPQIKDFRTLDFQNDSDFNESNIKIKDFRQEIDPIQNLALQKLVAPLENDPVSSLLGSKKPSENSHVPRIAADFGSAQKANPKIMPYYPDGMHLGCPVELELNETESLELVDPKPEHRMNILPIFDPLKDIESNETDTKILMDPRPELRMHIIPVFDPLDDHESNETQPEFLEDDSNSTKIYDFSKERMNILPILDNGKRIDSNSSDIPDDLAADWPFLDENDQKTLENPKERLRIMPFFEDQGENSTRIPNERMHIMPFFEDDPINSTDKEPRMHIMPVFDSDFDINSTGSSTAHRNQGFCQPSNKDWFKIEPENAPNWTISLPSGVKAKLWVNEGDRSTNITGIKVPLVSVNLNDNIDEDNLTETEKVQMYRAWYQESMIQMRELSSGNHTSNVSSYRDNMFCYPGPRLNNTDSPIVYCDDIEEQYKDATGEIVDFLSVLNNADDLATYIKNTPTSKLISLLDSEKTKLARLVTVMQNTDAENDIQQKLAMVTELENILPPEGVNMMNYGGLITKIQNFAKKYLGNDWTLNWNDVIMKFLG